jgi:CheY-like chemotaxis protein
MNITCEHCHTKLKIPGDKLPNKQTIGLTCPKCKNKTTINPSLANEVSSEEYSADDKPFDFLEQGAQTALVCEDDPAIREKIRSKLKKMNYRITEVSSQRDAMKNMRFHVYNLIVLNESFENSSLENNHILRYVNSLNMAMRRDIFVVLVGNNFRTMDNMTAFANSVNIVANATDLNQLEVILKKSLADHQEFYQTFKTALRSVGVM